MPLTSYWAVRTVISFMGPCTEWQAEHSSWNRNSPATLTLASVMPSASSGGAHLAEATAPCWLMTARAP